MKLCPVTFYALLQSPVLPSSIHQSPSVSFNESFCTKVLKLFVLFLLGPFAFENRTFVKVLLMTEHLHQNNLSKEHTLHLRDFIYLLSDTQMKLQRRTFRPLIIPPSSLLSMCYSHPEHLHFLLSSWEALNAGVQASDANGAQLQVSPFTLRFNLGKLFPQGSLVLHLQIR